jgi:LacI family transcriptional regulator
MKLLEANPSSSPKYLQLAEYFRGRIQAGALRPGDRLPSFSQMQAQHGIGQGTLERVYALLEDERLIVREPKRGTFVSDLGRRAKHNVVGLAFGYAPYGHPYYAALIEGIHDAAYREKVEVILMHDESRPGWERMDGVLTTYPEVSLPPAIPAVSLLRPAPGMLSILADDYGGGHAATKHLLALGHRRIACLAPGQRDQPAVEGTGYKPPNPRITGYRDALKEAGIKAKKSWWRPLREPYEPMRPFPELGYVRMREWLADDWEKTGCTAIMAQNDETAIGAMRALHQAGLRVPEDVSVIGFDGTIIAEHVTPSLSTMEVPLREIGATGLQRLLKLIREGSRPLTPGTADGPSEILPTRLIARDSTGRCNAP